MPRTNLLLTYNLLTDSLTDLRTKAAAKKAKQDGVVDMDDEDDDGGGGGEDGAPSLLSEISPRLWLSAEGRERWRAALEPPAAVDNGDDGDAEAEAGEASGGGGVSAARVAACLT